MNLDRSLGIVRSEVEKATLPAIQQQIPGNGNQSMMISNFRAAPVPVSQIFFKKSSFLWEAETASKGIFELLLKC